MFLPGYNAVSLWILHVLHMGYCPVIPLALRLIAVVGSVIMEKDTVVENRCRRAKTPPNLTMCRVICPSLCPLIQTDPGVLRDTCPLL